MTHKARGGETVLVPAIGVALVAAGAIAVAADPFAPLRRDQAGY